MLTEQTELSQLKQAVAILITCIVDALTDANPTFKGRFLINLDEAYAQVREAGGTAMNPKAMHDLEVLSWTREMVTGWSG
jgi:hypothetical protein